MSEKKMAITTIARALAKYSLGEIENDLATTAPTRTWSIGKKNWNDDSNGSRDPPREIEDNIPSIGKNNIILVAKKAPLLTELEMKNDRKVKKTKKPEIAKSTGLSSTFIRLTLTGIM